MRIWFSAIAVADIFFLFYYGIYAQFANMRIVPSMENLMDRDISEIFTTMANVISTLPPFLTLGLSIEKMIVVTWPLQRKRLTGVWKTSTAVVAMCLYLTMFWTLYILSTVNNWTVYVAVLVTVNLVANGLFIGFMHLLTSIFIVRALWKSRKERAAMVLQVNTAHHVPSSTTVTHPTGNNNNQLKMSAAEKRICLSLLAMNAIYFITVLPYLISTVESISGSLVSGFLWLLFIMTSSLDWIFLYLMNAEFRKMLCGRYF
jgi:hypothetical protein